ncbi:MAG TPA: AAA family ATPase, partial [Verrucomicrobiae bacterium]|nr:AAA family ATPase [Verrucomicrobiae bacterium]
TQIVAVGDRAQLTSIEAGGMWRTWADRAEQAGELAVLAENRRAWDPQDARAWDAIRRGAGVEAVKHYHAKGQVVITQSPEGAKDRAVAAWITDPRDAILVAESNRDLDALNRLAQTRRLEAHQALTKVRDGQSPAEVVEAMGLNPDTLAGWIAAEAEQPGSVALDPTPVQTTRDGKVQLVPMASVTVTAHDGPDYQRTETLRIGDRVECQQTTYVPALDTHGKAGADRRVSNGERGTIVGIHALGKGVRPKAGQTEAQAKQDAALLVVSFGTKTVVFGPDHRDRLRLGYAVSAYKSQGRTVDRVHVVTGTWQGDQRNAYVEMSRARKASYVYADMSSLEVDHGSLTAEQDALTALATRWQVFTPELTATEAVEQERARAAASVDRSTATPTADAGHDTATSQEATPELTPAQRHEREAQQRAQAQDLGRTLERAA